MINGVRRGIVNVGNRIFGKQVVRKKGLETMEMAILAVVLLAAVVVFKDTVIDVIQTVMAALKTAIMGFFS